MTHDALQEPIGDATEEASNAFALLVDPAAALDAARRLEKATAGAARRGGLSVRSALLDDDDEPHVALPMRRAVPLAAPMASRDRVVIAPTATRFLAVRPTTR